MVTDDVEQGALSSSERANGGLAPLPMTVRHAAPKNECRAVVIAVALV